MRGHYNVAHIVQSKSKNGQIEAGTRSINGNYRNTFCDINL